MFLHLTNFEKELDGLAFDFEVLSVLHSFKQQIEDAIGVAENVTDYFLAIHEDQFVESADGRIFYESSHCSIAQVS